MFLFAVKKSLTIVDAVPCGTLSLIWLILGISIPSSSDSLLAVLTSLIDKVMITKTATLDLYKLLVISNYDSCQTVSNLENVPNGAKNVSK